MVALTLNQLKNIIEDKYKQKQNFVFSADDYTVNIKFQENIYIYVVIESLNNYSSHQRNAILLKYVQQNTQILGYMQSTLSYTKSSEVIVQQYLNKYSDINCIIHAIDYLLQHADILINKQY